MKTLQYNVACKSCLSTDGVPHIIMLMDSYTDLFENRLLKSEYQLAKYVREDRIENEKPCPFCGSYNLDITEIEFDGKKAIVGQEVDQFQLVLSKHENGQIEIRTGGSKYLPHGFMGEAFKLIEEALSEAPAADFEEKQIGNVRFVISTGFIGHESTRTTRLEQFSFAGFDKATLQNIVVQIMDQILKTNS